MKIQIGQAEFTIERCGNRGQISSNQKYSDQEWQDEFGQFEMHAGADGLSEFHEHNGKIDVLESLILAHHMAGINVTSQAYKDGIQTTLDAIGNE